jgi:hypothetical protein
MAAAGTTIPLVGIAAAFRARGARLARLFVGACVAALGLASLALSEEIGAFDTPVGLGTRRRRDPLHRAL